MFSTVNLHAFPPVMSMGHGDIHFPSATYPMGVCITLGVNTAQNAEYHGHSKIKVEFLKPPKIYNSFSSDKQELMTIV